MLYVFDMAYYDFAWWAALDRAGCRFVTRLKTNTHLRATIEQPVDEDGDILSGRIGLLSERMARSRRNPFCDPLREIVVRIDTGRTIRLVTNDLDAPASEIADLYKQRWQIELFFRWLKQNLKIRHFFGASENAVRIQTDLEQFQQKCGAVLRPELRKNKEIEHFRDSEKNGNALCRTHRLSALADGPVMPERNRSAARFHPPRPPQPHAQKTNQRPAKTTAQTTIPSKPNPVAGI